MVKQKIAFFLPSLDGGGVRRMVVTLANALVEEDYEVDIVVCKKKGSYLKLIDHKVNIVNLNCSRVILSTFKLASYLNERKPNILYSGIEHTSIVAILAEKVSRVKTKVIVGAHTTLSNFINNANNKKNSLFIPYLIRKLYPSAHKILAVSNGVAEDLEKYLKKKDHISVVYNPVVCSWIYEKAQEPVEDWILEIDKKLLLAVGRLTDAKDYPTMLMAFKKSLENTSASSHLLIVGEGELREEVESCIKELGLHNNVSLVGFRSNPYKYMKQADAFILTSKWEGLPTVLIEAMSLGCPIISTDCKSGPNEILEGGKEGYLVPVGNIEEIAKGINEVLVNPIIPSEKSIRRFEEKQIVQEFIDHFKVG
ncbi:glycosyltransferase [Bacillus paranthracis]|uniref:glycosyltransferase n=1 Tax=Bacillus cereus group TaxID=86661 RepID=UPI0022DF7E52|nr:MULTISPECIES: glycosyltransferase [unclassified Bacillus cereus group]MDA1891113.1 glycosyltransferase [Bacillus cereus group sp. BY11-1LC]MDA2592463.1 glycosyltransferase [Bacillus cereus group sp. Bc065]